MRKLALVVLLVGCQDNLTAREVCQDLAFSVCSIAVACERIPESAQGRCTLAFEERCCPDYGCDWEADWTSEDQAACTDVLLEESCDIFGKPLPPGCPAPRGGLPSVGVY